MIFEKKHLKKEAGFTLVEVCVAVGLSILLGTAIISSLLQSMSYAASARLMTNARAITHRNIDAAAGVAFTDINSAPPMLVPTNGAWSVCEDDGATVTGTTVENIQLSGSNNSVVVTGTLSRIVEQENVSENAYAAVYRITYKVDYRFLAKDFTYSETTLRAIDKN